MIKQISYFRVFVKISQKIISITLGLRHTTWLFFLLDYQTMTFIIDLSR